jgi:type I restriction enzyme, S subunit
MTATARTTPLISLPVHAATVRASTLAAGDRRFEAETYLTEGYQLRQRIEKIGAFPLQAIANVWQPGRLKGIQVARNHGTPFLAATQVFDIRPMPRKWLALPRTHDVDERYVKHEWILVTRSGSVGNAIMGYRAIDGMIISDDLLRVVTNKAEDRGYLYIFLRSRHARAMMRSSKYGNVIKHLEPEHLQAIPVVSVGDRIKQTINVAVERCFALRREAYELSLAAENDFAAAVGQIDISGAEIGYSVRASDLFRKSRRLDAYSYNPVAGAILMTLAKSGKKCESVANLSERVFLPNRFVRGIPLPDGVPILGSEELFMVNPEIDKFLPKSAADDELMVKRNWILLARSGQIYGINGRVVLASKWHEEKIISDHAIRIVPKNVRPGYLLTALGHPTLGRPLVLREVFGTSIPEIDPASVQDIPILRLGDLEDAIADKAEHSASLQSTADEMENAAVTLIESVISHAIGDASEDDVDAALARVRLAEIEAAPESLVQGKALKARLARVTS